MADPTIEELQEKIEEPDNDPELPPSDDNTERYFETLKRFIADAKNAKKIGVPLADKFWESMHLEEISSAIELVESLYNPLNRAAQIGKALGGAAMACKPDIDYFLADRSANGANPDHGAAATKAFLGSSDWITNPVNKAIGNLTTDDIWRTIKTPYLVFKYKFKQHDYVGCAEEALNYFARAKSYYDAM